MDSKIKTSDATLARLLSSGKQLEQSINGHSGWVAKKEGVNTMRLYYREKRMRIEFDGVYSRVKLFSRDRLSYWHKSVPTIQLLVRIAQRCRSARKRYVLPRKMTAALGHVGFITTKGDATIGCQKFSWSQDIEPFARSQGWL